MFNKSLFLPLARYVAWNVHEQNEGKYNFDGDNDLVDFIQVAQSVGLLVIVRAGEWYLIVWAGEWYICVIRLL